ncbi:hypothetical protein E1N66_12280 [Pantoea allii]|uniref:hypothetical protein n=1 Tax=Enterobacter agglomerans TaxID=549 RepID=UPI00109E0F70|nr:MULTISPECIES: hypothetical protein [Pantoea]THB84080.1 hypothetical protein E1N66_12280 [Pantoea allii]
MKKLAQYRRSNGPNAGFSEKLAWQLSKGPATGRELAERFGMSLREFNRLIINTMRHGGKTLQVEASNQVSLGGNSIDRTYTLIRRPRRVAPQALPPMVINQSNDRSEESIKRHRAAAKRRARLIASGIYMKCMG